MKQKYTKVEIINDIPVSACSNCGCGLCTAYHGIETFVFENSVTILKRTECLLCGTPRKDRFRMSIEAYLMRKAGKVKEL